MTADLIKYRSIHLDILILEYMNEIYLNKQSNVKSCRFKELVNMLIK